jgi:CubicO group peptidase (beta-lactamase class C family)
MRERNGGDGGTSADLGGQQRREQTTDAESSHSRRGTGENPHDQETYGKPGHFGVFIRSVREQRLTIPINGSRPGSFHQDRFYRETAASRCYPSWRFYCSDGRRTAITPENATAVEYPQEDHS